MSARLLNEERGWLIVETMIGAVVLVIGGIAIYNGLDGAAKTSGKNRNRTEASILAQQDQERMRTMDATALSNYSRVAQVQVGKLKYTVTSTASYVSDSSGAVSCTNSSTTAQYLKISSSVADPTRQNKPVVEDSLLSPKPTDGGAAVQLVDRNAAGVSGIPVSLHEAPSTTLTTDSQGCVLFGFLDTSTDYGVDFSSPGYVDPSGNNQLTDASITQVPGSTTLTQFQYDVAGSVTANFVTSPGSGTSGTMGNDLTAFNTHIPGTQFRTFSNGNVANNLFPFTDPYTFYTGNCLIEKPPSTSTKVATATVTPGSAQTVTVTEPAVKVTVPGSTTAKVYLKESDPGCTDSYTTTVNSSGVSYYGYPYGHFYVCASSSGGGRWTWSTTPIDNTGDNGNAITLPALPSTGNSKNTTYCP